MSPDLERLIGRAIVDKKFRKELLDDPDAAVNGAGFSLTAEELDKLRDAVKRHQQDDIDKQLEAMSGGGW